jgi:hypothetical protein
MISPCAVPLQHFARRRLQHRAPGSSSPPWKSLVETLVRVPSGLLVRVPIPRSVVVLSDRPNVRHWKGVTFARAWLTEKKYLVGDQNWFRYQALRSVGERQGDSAGMALNSDERVFGLFGSVSMPPVGCSGPGESSRGFYWRDELGNLQRCLDRPCQRGPFPRQDRRTGASANELGD